MGTVNPYSNLVGSMIELQLAGIGTQATVSQMNQMATDENQRLSYLWTSCEESKEGDPGHKAYCELMGGTYTSKKTGKSTTYLPVTTAAGMQAWITQFLAAPTNPPSGSKPSGSKPSGSQPSGSQPQPYENYSSEFMTLVEQKFEQYCSGTPDASTGLSLISSCSSLFSSQAQSEEQSGQTVISNLNSVSQHFESDQGPLGSASTTLLDAANNFASAMQSITA